MAKLRVHLAARRFGVSSRELLTVLRESLAQDVRGPSSTLTASVVAQLAEHYGLTPTARSPHPYHLDQLMRPSLADPPRRRKRKSMRHPSAPKSAEKKRTKSALKEQLSVVTAPGVQAAEAIRWTCAISSTQRASYSRPG